MNHKYKIIVLVLASAVMQSCFTAKTYERPQLKSENNYRLATATTDTTSLADISWNELFTDPMLQKHINSGLQYNYDIRIAIQNIAAAEANMTLGRAGYFPTVGLGADWTHQQLSKNSQF